MSTETHTIDDSNNFAKGINQSLLANINHALRTPLNGMIGMMALLENQGLQTHNPNIRVSFMIQHKT